MATVVPLPKIAPMESVRDVSDTLGAHQRESDAVDSAATSTVLNKRSTAVSVMYVCDAGTPVTRLRTPRWRGAVSVSTYTVPGVPGSELPTAAPPDARSCCCQSPPLLVAA